MTNKIDSLPWWVAGAVLLSVVSFLATGIVWLINPALLAPKIIVDSGTVSNEASVVADYLAIRHLVLGFALLSLLLRKKYLVLGYFLLAAGGIQLLDAVMDLVHSDFPSGPIILAIVNLVGAYSILRSKKSDKKR